MPEKKDELSPGCPVPGNSKRQSPVTPWQPVGTAPAGEYLLVRFERLDRCNVLRKDERTGVWFDEGGSGYRKPDWWMKLPQSPLQAQDGTNG